MSSRRMTHIRFATAAAVGMAGVLALPLALHSQKPTTPPALRQTATAAAAPATRPAEHSTEAPNPHWKPGTCTACHETADSRVQPIPPSKINDVCWRCHDGKQAHQEVHPVGRKFAGEGIVQPEGWPAPDSLLTCTTCHEFRPDHSLGGPRPAVNPMMLRDYETGPISPFCAKCHVRTPAHKPFNPHHMLTAQGDPMHRNCLLCHTSTTDVLQRTVRTGRPDLQDDEVALCVRCHRRHVDWFEPGHIGITMPPAMRAYKAAREKSAREAQTAASQPAAVPITPELPLGQGGRVVCSTCHNPHQQGLFPATSPLGLGAMNVNDPHAPQEFRGLGKELCRGCHQN